MQIKAFEPSKFWHRIRGHKVALVPFDPATAKSPVLSTIVRDECSCGAQWVFYGLTMTQTFVPAPKDQPLGGTPGSCWCHLCGWAVCWHGDAGGYFHVANPNRRPPCDYGDGPVPNRAVRS